MKRCTDAVFVLSRVLKTLMAELHISADTQTHVVILWGDKNGSDITVNVIVQVKGEL